MFISNNPKVIIIKPVLIISILFFYDTLWDGFLSLLHHLFGILHIVFEFCEHTLEGLIEHLFHVDPRTAEVLVFYVMLSIGAYVTLKLIQLLPDCYRALVDQVTAYWQQSKAETLEYWQAQSLKGKIQWVTIFMSVVLVMVLWLSS
jgi:pimeloyl-ACP methyl ester carboxylesterase